MLFDGGATTFIRFKPLLLIELNPMTLERFGATVESPVSKLRKFDYQLFAYKWWSGLSLLRRIPQGDEYLNIVGMVKRARSSPDTFRKDRSQPK
jgi:hypothetical protein